jgi:hypothetical protein
MIIQTSEKIFINKDRLSRTCVSDIEYICLKTLGSPVVQRITLYGGRCTIPLDDVPYSGHQEWFVYRGGIFNRETPDKMKCLFKEEVLPVLSVLCPQIIDSMKWSARVHLLKGDLQRIDIMEH